MTTQAELLEKIEDILIAYGENYEEHHCEPSDVVAGRILALLPPAPAAGDALSKIDTLSQYTGENPTAQLFAIQQIVREHRKALAALSEGGA